MEKENNNIFWKAVRCFLYGLGFTVLIKLVHATNLLNLNTQYHEGPNSNSTK